jgi:N-acetylmuramoyl-L-alanine amidase
VTDEAGAKLCSVRYYDADGDGHGTSQTKCVCMGDPKYRADLGDDCDDTNDEVHPGADEVCDNGLDDDCDGAKDEALPNCKTCVPYYWDLDWDGYGVTTKWQCLKESMSPYTTKVPGDCADGDPAINPGKPEKCNGMDDDCDGLTDEEGALGCKILFLDADQDGAGVTGSTRCLCAAADGYSATTGGDCDDNDPQRSPGIPETCNGLDDDCDGDVDEEGAGGCTTYYFDEDGDGKGVTDLAHCFCAPAGKFRGTEPGDCNDADPAVHPGAKESCNGIDDDCNGATDEEGATGCSPLYYDADGDGWGVAGKSKCLCHEQGKYRAPNEGDCDDDDPARNGGAEDVCNGKDDDCDGQTDEEGACAVRIGIDPAGGAGSGACGCACEDDLNLSIALALKDVLDADTLNASGGGSWKVTLSRGSTSENPSAADRLATFAAAKVERVLVIGSSAAAGSQCEAGQGDGASALVASFAGVHAMDLASRTLDAATSALGVADRGVVRAGAGGVVNGATVPAVRVEWGFATDPGDVAKIQSSGAPAALATALLHALQGHYGLSPFAP